MRTFSSLLVVTFMVQEGMFAFLLGCVYHAAMPMRATPREGPHTPSGPNLLDESLERLHNEPCQPSLEVVKRLATSGKRVNHDSQ